MIIRIGTQVDVPLVMPLLKEMHETAQLKLPSIDPDKVCSAMFNVVAQGLMLIAETNDKKVAGLLAILESSPWYSSEKIVVDQVFYVAQKYRQSSAAIKLLNAGKKIVEKMDKPFVVAIFNGADVERKITFFQRLGFKQIGATLGKGI